jgi:hypothetical protein
MATALKFGTQSHESDAPAFAVRHFSPAEIAEMWGLSVDSIRKLFEEEPGVLIIGNQQPKPGKRSYTTLRIPQAVVERVHRRLSKV